MFLSANLNTNVNFQAEDSDRGANAELHYSLDSSCFSISNSTGQISVACDIDRETKASFALSVKVSDSAPTPLTTTTQIEVIIDDSEFFFSYIFSNSFKISYFLPSHLSMNAHNSV